MAVIRRLALPLFIDDFILRRGGQLLLGLKVVDVYFLEIPDAHRVRWLM